MVRAVASDRSLRASSCASVGDASVHASIVASAIGLARNIVLNIFDPPSREAGWLEFKQPRRRLYSIFPVAWTGLRTTPGCTAGLPANRRRRRRLVRGCRDHCNFIRPQLAQLVGDLVEAGAHARLVHTGRARQANPADHVVAD